MDALQRACDGIKAKVGEMEELASKLATEEPHRLITDQEREHLRELGKTQMAQHKARFEELHREVAAQERRWKKNFWQYHPKIATSCDDTMSVGELVKDSRAVVRKAGLLVQLQVAEIAGIAASNIAIQRELLLMVEKDMVEQLGLFEGNRKPGQGTIIIL